MAGKPRAKINANQLSKALGVSKQAVLQSQLVQRLPDGEIDIPATMTMAQLREETERESYRKEKALADLREMEAQEKRGDLIAMAVVAQDWERRAAMIRDGLLAAPDRIAQQAGKEPQQVRIIREAMMAEIRKLLAELAGTVGPEPQTA